MRVAQRPAVREAEGCGIRIGGNAQDLIRGVGERTVGHGLAFGVCDHETTAADSTIAESWRSRFRGMLDAGLRAGAAGPRRGEASVRSQRRGAARHDRHRELHLGVGVALATQAMVMALIIGAWPPAVTA
ncbi:hypothetical protein GCM10023152_12880 [Agromyces bauzanensis]|uniref:Uncharacterized protein n=1 Tax=Agromyces bauzanensis TaxID=1308924 RepID=A0A917ULI1_9MICO|nr:hypothetical protein GCM10011372_00050 [Agromyces bauzanensis]